MEDEMTSRERVLAAVRHEIPDRIPVAHIGIHPVDIAAHFGIDVSEVDVKLGKDDRYLWLGQYTGETFTDNCGSPLNEWNMLENPSDYGTSRLYPLQNAESIADIEHFKWPDGSMYDVSDSVTLAREYADVYAVRGPAWEPIFSRTCQLFGMEEAMVKMMVQSDIYDAAVAHIAEHVQNCSELLMDACGDDMPILYVSDDFATQRGLMMDPEQWRRVFKPHFARLFEMAKRRGKFVWLHACGDITSVLPDLIDIGLDVWETVQLHSLPMTPLDLKKEFGRHLTFFGGINTQDMPFKTPDEVRMEVTSCIEALGEGGGYIVGPDHTINPDVDWRATIALFEAATSFRREGFTL